MSLFGKLLAIFNVLAAIAFVCVGVLDHSQRQAWSFAVLRADWLIQGLPFDETEFTLDGDKRFEQLDTKALGDVFSNAGGNPQPTQLAEVRRVQGIVNAYLAQSPSPDELEEVRKELVEGLAGQPGRPPVLQPKSLRLGSQITQLEREIALETSGKRRPEVLTSLNKERDEAAKKKAEVDAFILALSKPPLDDQTRSNLQQLINERKHAALLLPFAATSVEFEDLVDRKASWDPTRPIGDLKDQLAELFNQVLNGQVTNNVGAHKLNVDERKLATARLLYNLIYIGAAPKTGYEVPATGLQRVITVCGLANTAHAVQAQTVALNKMAQDLTYTLDRERSDFVTEEFRVMGRSQDLADELRKQQVYLRAQEDLVSRQIDLVKALDLNIEKLKSWLKDAQNTTQEKLTEQAEMEKSLFEARKKLRDTQMLNEKLEQQIRELEKAKGQ